MLMAMPVLTPGEIIILVDIALEARLLRATGLYYAFDPLSHLASNASADRGVGQECMRYVRCIVKLPPYR